MQKVSFGPAALLKAVLNCQRGCTASAAAEQPAQTRIAEFATQKKLDQACFVLTPRPEVAGTRASLISLFTIQLFNFPAVWRVPAQKHWGLPQPWILSVEKCSVFRSRRKAGSC